MQGLGLVSARALVEHGVDRLAIFDVDHDMGDQAVEHLKSMLLDEYDCNITFEAVDVTKEESVNSMVHYIGEVFRGIDILLCFAGITESKLAVEYPLDSWKRIFDVNVHGCFSVARAVARYFPISPLPTPQTLRMTHHHRTCIARQRPTSMVFVASMSGYIVNIPQTDSAYAVSKAAVHHLARSMAGEWVGHGIRVNSISPGIVNTRLSGGDAQKDLRRLWLEKSPMGIGDAEDLTGAVVLLCSEAGRFITGTDIKIDGEFFDDFGV